MKRIRLLSGIGGAFLLITGLLSCEGKLDKKNQGQIIISSAFDFNTALVSGYNFELQAFTQFPSSGDPLPDILIEQFRDPAGEISPGLASPENQNGFAFIEQFNSLEGSLDFFNNSFTSFEPVDTYVPGTDTLKLYQVWVLKTSSDKYVKLHIRDIKQFQGASGAYLEVWLDFSYQADGTPDFSR